MGSPGTISTKPLGIKCYGSIPHLPGSRRGPGDKGVNEGQDRICQIKARDANDEIWVLLKLDGSNVGIVMKEGQLIPLNRAGYHAASSPFPHHRLFAEWVSWPEQRERFHALLGEGERVVGEWLPLAHGTRYDLPHEPFVAFDLMTGPCHRAPTQELLARLTRSGFTHPRVLHRGGPITIARVLQQLESAAGPDSHGHLDPIEGAVWRVERCGKVEFLAKYVQPDKVDGLYLFHWNQGQPTPRANSELVWNNWPGKSDPTGPYAAWIWAYQK